MEGKIRFVNKSSRLVAAQVGKNEFIVFEYSSKNLFECGDIVEKLSNEVGRNIVVHTASGESASIKKGKVAVNILSTIMDFTKAKLVVAPWQDVAENEWQTA